MLTSSFIFFIVAHLNFSGQASEPSKDCNETGWGTINYPIVCLDLGISVITLLYYSLKKNSQDRTGNALSMLEMGKISDVSEDNEAEEILSKYAEELQRSEVYFHLVMAIYGTTIGMILSNWGLSNGWDTYMASGARIVQMLTLLALYMWSLFAPTCCPGRDFG